MIDVGAHIIVSGMVQGVGFRFYVYTHANKLGLSGYVSNLYDGNVEILVEGNRTLIEELIKAVKIGPRDSHVADVKIEWRKAENRFNKFYVQ